MGGYLWGLGGAPRAVGWVHGGWGRVVGRAESPLGNGRFPAEWQSCEVAMRQRFLMQIKNKRDQMPTVLIAPMRGHWRYEDARPPTRAPSWRASVTTWQITRCEEFRTCEKTTLLNLTSGDFFWHLPGRRDTEATAPPGPAGLGPACYGAPASGGGLLARGRGSALASPLGAWLT